MKVRIAVAVGVIALIAAAVAAVVLFIGRGEARTVKVMIGGDSIAYGYACDIGDLLQREVQSLRLRHTKVQVWNLAIPGTTTTQWARSGWSWKPRNPHASLYAYWLNPSQPAFLLERSRALAGSYPEPGKVPLLDVSLRLCKDPQYIFFIAGTNDHEHILPAATLENLQGILRKVRGRSKIFFGTPPKVARIDWNGNEEDRRLWEAWEANLARIGELMRDSRLVAPGMDFQAQDISLSADGIHPSRRGCRVMAQAMFQIVKNELDDN